MKRTNFFTKLKNNLYNVKTFSEYVKEGFSSAVKYALLLFAILAVIQGVYIGYKTHVEISKSVQSLEESKIDFMIKDGILTLSDSPQKFEDDGIYMIADSNTEIKDSAKLESEYIGKGSIILALKDGIKIEGGGLSQTFYYKDLFPSGLTREDVINQIKYASKIIIPLSIVMTTFMNAINFIFNILAIASVGMVISLLLRIRVKFKSMVSLVIYAITLPSMLIVPLNLFFGQVYADLPVIMATITFLFFILRDIKIGLMNRIN